LLIILKLNFQIIRANVFFTICDRELEKIELQGEDLYLPTAPTKLVTGIQVDSGIPLQSAAKVPIMITFNVVDRDGDRSDVKPQACIFKVGLFQAFFFYIWLNSSIDIYNYCHIV
jgi:hypothetical protein